MPTNKVGLINQAPTLILNMCENGAWPHFLSPFFLCFVGFDSSNPPYINILLFRCKEGNIIVHSLEQEAIRKMLLLVDILRKIPRLKAKELKERL